MASIGRNIKTYRRKNGLSQEELAERVFTTRQTISNYENGKSNPDIETLEKLAAALDTDIMSLLYGERPAPEQALRARVKKLTLWVAVLAAAVFGLLRLLGWSGVLNLLLWDQAESRVVVHTDIAEYERYIGPAAEETYRSKFGMDESIFPARITPEMQVLDYKMVYYNPWDAQYLSVLAVRYDETGYAAEERRLQALPPAAYRGLFGVTGFPAEYELLAVNTDPSYGLIYALGDGAGEIVYVELLFCNYFMDLDYTLYIDEAYLPVGFDATRGNAYRQELLGEG